MFDPLPEFHVDYASPLVSFDLAAGDNVPKVRLREFEGFLQGEAIVTRTGVFLYLNPDGTIRREAKLPEEVMRADSLDTMRGIPITLMHPPTLVTAENATRYAIGAVGDRVYSDDGKHVIASVTIWDEAAIESIKGGMHDVSLGYRLAYHDDAGEYDGEPYDLRQRNIRYNHLAVVAIGRVNVTAERTRYPRPAMLNLAVD